MDPLTADDPRMIGEFRLRARLGAGGMGRVYLAFSPAGRAVAVKVIHPHLAREAAFAVRFRREVAAAQAVNAVYATPVVAAGPDDDPPWLATAFVPGPSLQDVVATTGPLPADAVLRLAAGLAEALRAVHAQGLVHRDLKPGNVLLATDGPRVIDFGIARVLDGTELTSAESILGTPSFMSPEQALGGQTGPPSDVFSLGGVTYFAATAMAPFGTGIPAAVLYRIVHTEPGLDGLPPALRGLVSACLEKDPADRPSPARLAAVLGQSAATARSGAMFWPETVVRLIRDYQAGVPQQRDPGLAPGPGPGPDPGRRLARETRRVARHGGRGTRAGVSRRRVLAGGLAGVAAAGLAAGGWELTRPRDTGHVPSAGQARKPGSSVWSFAANGLVNAVALAGGVVYAGTDEDTVYALNAATGKPLWRHVISGAEQPQLTLARDVIVISGYTGILALNPGTGERLWGSHTAPGSPGQVATAAAGDVIYAGVRPRSATTDGVTALRAATGDVLWTYSLSLLGDETGGIAVSGGVVYAVTALGGIVALDAATGSQRWQAASLYGYLIPPVVADGIVYASGSTDANSVYAIDAVDAATGAAMWHRTVGDVSPAYAAVADGVVFTSVQGGLAALNGASGQTLWRVPVDGGVDVWPAVAGNVVYSGSRNGVLNAWQATTGNKLWSHPASAVAVTSNMVLAGDTLYFGGEDHDVRALAVYR